MSEPLLLACALELGGTNAPQHSGTYKADVYSVSEDNPFDESNLIMEGNGTMTGTRVKPD